MNTEERVAIELSSIASVSLSSLDTTPGYIERATDVTYPSETLSLLDNEETITYLEITNTGDVKITPQGFYLILDNIDVVKKHLSESSHYRDGCI